MMMNMSGINDSLLRENEKKYRSLVDHSMEGFILITGPPPKLIFANSTLAETIGYSIKELLAMSSQEIYERIHPDDREMVFRRFADRISGKEIPARYEFRAITRDGRTIFLEISSALVHDHQGTVVQVFLMDITERKRVEEELRRSRDELELRVRERTDELEARTALLTRLSSQLTLTEKRERRRMAEILHDHLQQLMVGAKLSQERVVQEIDGAPKADAVRVLELINQLIETSRSLTSELSPPILWSGDLSASMKWLARWMEETHGLQIRFLNENPISLMRNDLTILLFRSVQELFFNVLKHSGEKSAAIRIEKENRRLRVIVSDHGSGFDPETVLKDSDAAQKFGLVSIHERLLYLGGRMELESGPASGTRVSLIVPLQEDESAEKGPEDLSGEAHKKHVPEESEPGGFTQKLRVMLVDDHIVLREALSNMLSLYPDIEVVGEAADGEKAVHLARELNPDVILMDISMPVMDGLAATRIIHSELPHIRIIGLSMYDEDAQAEAMLNAGASAYRSKGSDTTSLLLAIRNGDEP